MTTLGSAAEFDKECVRHALAGELYAGENERGSVFEKATKTDCDAYVLETFDRWYHTAKQLADSGRAIEAIMQRHGWVIELDEYMRAIAEAEREFNLYLYEYQKEDLAEELREIEKSNHQESK